MSSQSPLLVQTVKNVTVVTINDASLVEARVIESVREGLFELLEKQHRTRMILDLSKVSYLSSAALGVLLPLQKMFAEKKGTLLLCGLRKEIEKLFKVTGVSKFFRVFRDESAALMEFGITM